MKTLRTLLTLFVALALNSCNGQSKSNIMKTKMQDSLIIAAILEQNEDFLNINLSSENVNKIYDIPVVYTMNVYLHDNTERTEFVEEIEKGTLLHLTARNDLPISTRILIEKGADVNAKNVEGRTPLEVAYSNGTKEFQETLIKNGANMNFYVTAFLRNEPLLFCYIWDENYDLAKLAIEHGADVNMEIKDGGSILEFAERRGTPEIIKMLKAKGATK